MRVVLLQLAICPGTALEISHQLAKNTNEAIEVVRQLAITGIEIIINSLALFSATVFYLNGEKRAQYFPDSLCSIRVLV